MSIPNYLFALISATPASRFAFPPHLYDGAGSGVSGIDEVQELMRILRDWPETVVVQNPIPTRPFNDAIVAQRTAYLRTCQKLRSVAVSDHDSKQVQNVHSHCGRNY